MVTPPKKILYLIGKNSVGYNFRHLEKNSSLLDDKVFTEKVSPQKDLLIPKKFPKSQKNLINLINPLLSAIFILGVIYPLEWREHLISDVSELQQNTRWSRSRSSNMKL